MAVHNNNDNVKVELASARAMAIVREIAAAEGLDCDDCDVAVTAGSSAGDNYLGEIYRVVVVGGGDKRLSLIIKLAPANPVLRRGRFVQQFYHREAAVYARMLPALDAHQAAVPAGDRFRFARMRSACLDDGDEMIVMDDLGAGGFRMRDRHLPFDREHLALCVKSLARLHAAAMALGVKDPRRYDEMCSLSIKPESMGGALETFMLKNFPALRKIVENKPPAYKEKLNKCLDTLLDDVAAFYDAAPTAPYNVLCHGDCWSNNMLFQYENDKLVDMRFLDWQLMRNASPVTDLAYSLFTGTDKEMRAKHYHEMLNLYYKTLSANATAMGVDVSVHYPELVYRQQIRTHMKYGVLMSFGILPLTLSDRGAAPDLGELITADGGDGHAQPAEVVFSEACAERVADVIEDAIAYGII